MKHLLILAALLICSCSQTSTTTPPTRLSNGYVAYTVAGQRDSIPDLSVAGDPGFLTLDCAFATKDSILTVNAIAANRAESVNLTLQQFSAPGKYSLSAKDGGSATYLTAFYVIDSIHGGSVDVSQIDTVQKVMSGTFRFLAKGYVNGDRVTIDSGKFFRVPYRLYPQISSAGILPRLTPGTSRPGSRSLREFPLDHFFEQFTCLLPTKSIEHQ